MHSASRRRPAWMSSAARRAALERIRAAPPLDGGRDRARRLHCLVEPVAAATRAGRDALRQGGTRARVLLAGAPRFGHRIAPAPAARNAPLLPPRRRAR